MQDNRRHHNVRRPVVNGAEQTGHRNGVDQEHASVRLGQALTGHLDLGVGRRVDQPEVHAGDDQDEEAEGGHLTKEERVVDREDLASVLDVEGMQVQALFQPANPWLVSG